MSKTDKIEPRWVLVDGLPHDVSDFAGLEVRDRPDAVCPLCERSVVLKLGAINVHHYAHRVEASCAASQSETALHLNTKFHFYHQLRAAGAAPLLLEQRCGECYVEKQNQTWLEAWDDVQIEYRMDAMRPDIALLWQGRVVAALEILVTHAVDERKAALLEEQGIPWLEISGDPAFYTAPTAWTAGTPLVLPSWELPYPAWTCQPCALRLAREKREQE